MRAHYGSDGRVRSEQHAVAPGWQALRIIFCTSRLELEGRREVTNGNRPVRQHAVLLVGPYEFIRFSQALPVAFTKAVFYTTVPDVVRVEAPIQITCQHSDIRPKYLGLLQDLLEGVHALVELALVGGPVFFFVLSLCVLCISPTPSASLDAIGA